MLITLTVLLVRQYRLAGSRQEFFKWMFQAIRNKALKTVRIIIFFLLIATGL